MHRAGIYGDRGIYSKYVVRQSYLRPPDFRRFCVEMKRIVATGEDKDLGRGGGPVEPSQEGEQGARDATFIAKWHIPQK